MTKRAFLLVFLALTAFAAGCSEVESCTELVTPGCLHTAPRSDGTCLFDLVLSSDGLCERSGGGGGVPCDECGPGGICDATTNNKCVDFCEQPDMKPGSVQPPEAIFCEAIATDAMPNPPMLSFEEVCRRRCRLNCQRLQQFCPGYVCPAGSCDGADVLARCTADCPPVVGNDVQCITGKCNDIRFTPCSNDISCPNGARPNCSSISCSNNCMFSGQDVTGDGSCDDGDVYSSYTAQCAWGTDCADCGPRTGSEKIGDPGAVCQYTLNCKGGTGSPKNAQAWCVGLESLPGVARCMPDCSRNQPCPAGFTCRQALFILEDGSQGQIMEEGYASSACLPDACL